MRRRTAVCLSAAATLLAAAPAAAPVRGHAAGPAYTVTAGTFTATKIGPNRDTGCAISYDLYVPSPTPAAGTSPAILTTNGFGGSKADQADVGVYFASRGYTVLSYSGLGFGGSGCNIELDDPDWDGQAASQLIDYLGTLPYVKKDGPDDPRVGMIGGSYGGAIQLATASVTRKLDTIIPEITWNDLAYSLTPNNVDADFVHRDSPPGVPKFEWTELFFGLGASEPLQHAGSTPVPPSTCPGFDPRVCPSNISSAATSYPVQSTIDLLRHASMVGYGSSVRIPTMLMQGQADTLFNINDAVANMRQIQANGARVKLVLQDWGHSNGARARDELDFTNLQNPGYQGLLVQRWFDHYLKDLPVDTGPDVEYLRDWAYASTGDAATAYAQAPSWPVGTTESFALSGTSDLVPSGSPVVAGSATAVNPGVTGLGPLSYSETSSVQQTTQPFQSIPPTDETPGFASWQTPPLATDLDSVGIPTATLHFTSALPAGIDPLSAPTFFAKIYDVAPDGSVDLPERLVSPVRVMDTSRPVVVTLPGLVHRYAAGHRIRLVLAATDAAYVSSRVANVYTVTTDPAAPSTLTLPVVRAAATVPASTDQTGGGQAAPTTAATIGLANTAAAPAAAGPLSAGVLLLGAGAASRRRRRRRG